MWHKFGLAALFALWFLVPAGAQEPQYFQHPRYELPGRPSPDTNSPPGRVSPFPGNPGYVPPNAATPQQHAPRGDLRVRWAFTAEGGGIFENTAAGVWTVSRQSGQPVNFVELYRTPAYVELYHPGTGIGIRLSGNMLYQDYGGLWYPIFPGSWE